MCTPVWYLATYGDKNDELVLLLPLSALSISVFIAVKFGRGFLIHIAISLDEEREYKIVLDIIRRISLIGYEMLAMP